MTEFRALYGDALIIEHSESLPADPREAIQRFDEIVAHVDVVEVVLPIALLDAIQRSNYWKSGRPVIRSVMNRTVDENGVTTFTFSHYEKINRIVVETERLTA